MRRLTSVEIGEIAERIEQNAYQTLSPCTVTGDLQLLSEDALTTLRFMKDILDQCAQRQRRDVEIPRQIVERILPRTLEREGQ